MVLQHQNVVSFPRPDRTSTKAKASKVRFTQAKIEGLRHAGGGPEYVYDSEKPGLAVRLTSGGARTFVFVGRLHGRVTRITLGRVGSLTLAKARAGVDKIRGDVALGIDVIAQRRGLRDANFNLKTLDEAFAEFVAGERHKVKTLIDYRNLLALHIAGGLGRKAIKDVTADDVRKIHAKVAAAVVVRIKERTKRRATKTRALAADLMGTHTKHDPANDSEDWKGHRTANKVAALLRAVLAFAGRRADNPAGEVTWFKQTPRRRRLSDQEALKFRRALEDFEEAWRDFFTISLLKA